jgi:ParB/RepB/Spo0J family partition protein
LNAQATPGVRPDSLALAANNQAILRALRAAPIAGDAAVAKAADVPQKNVGRQLKLLQEHQLVERLNGSPMVWDLTRAGRVALEAIDLAEGRATSEPPASAGADALLLLHHQVRPNPLQPRKLRLGEPGQEPPTKDRVELDQLKASIAADLALGGPGVLQNLTVFPADPDGVHTIFAGERRWRAVGELIAEGVWPTDKRLRAVQRETSAGQTAFVALVENGQRSNLSMLEEARAYADLCDETGWSARHAALQTGRDPRSVQQMLQVVRDADPEAIVRHEANPDDYTWEDLRRSVQKHAEGESSEPGGRDPDQIDLEEAAEPHRPFAFDARDRELLDYKSGHYRKLKPSQRLMLVELADKLLRDPHPDYPGYTAVAPDHVGTSSDFILAGAGFMSGGGMSGCCGRVCGSSLELLRLDGLLTACGDRAAILRRAREEAGVAVARIADLEVSGGYATPWLDPSWTPPPRPTGFGEALEQFTERARNGQPLDPDSLGPADPPGSGGYEPDTLARLALGELAHKVQHHGEHNGWAQVRQYWRDQTFAELKTAGLVAVTHSLENGPHAQLTTKGQGVLTGIAGLLDDVALDKLRFEASVDPEEGQSYATPWLNNLDGGNAALPQVSTSEIVNAMGDDDDDDTVEALDRAILADVRSFLEDAISAEPPRAVDAAFVQRQLQLGATFSGLLDRLWVSGPLWADVGDNAGGVFDASGEEVLTVDVNRENSDARAEAIGLLVAFAINQVAGRPHVTRPAQTQSTEG